MNKLFKFLMIFFGSQERRISRLEREFDDFADGMTYDFDNLISQTNQIGEDLAECIRSSESLAVRMEGYSRQLEENQQLREKYNRGEITSEEVLQQLA